MSDALVAALESASGCLPLPDKLLASGDSELLAAVAAAGLPHLPPGPGVMLEQTKEGFMRREVPCLSMFVLGHHVGHHVKVFRKVGRMGGERDTLQTVGNQGEGGGCHCPCNALGLVGACCV